MSDQLDRPLSSYAFTQYGGDAKLYNGIRDLETANERLEGELAEARAQLAAALGIADDDKRATVRARKRCETLAAALHGIIDAEGASAQYEAVVKARAALASEQEGKP